MNNKLVWVLVQLFYSVLVYGWLFLNNQEAKWITITCAIIGILIALGVTDSFMQKIVLDRKEKRVPFAIRFLTELGFVVLFLYFGKYFVASTIGFSFIIFAAKNDKAVEFLRAHQSDSKEIFP